jgi:hypothetical protein
MPTKDPRKDLYISKSAIEYMSECKGHNGKHIKK